MTTRTNYDEIGGRSATEDTTRGAAARIRGTIGWVLGIGAVIYMLLAAAAGVFVR